MEEKKCASCGMIHTLIVCPFCGSVVSISI
jgi:rRNA maturation protein Nop10